MNPKRLSKSIVMMLAVCAVFLVSCANHGTKVTVPGTKGEVYYKGEGVTEEDAVKLGKYLKESGYFNDREKTVQIKRAGKSYEVRMVVDMDQVKDAKGIDDAFTTYGANIATQVFDNTPVVIILCDTGMNDKKNYPYNPDILEAEAAKSDTGEEKKNDENSAPDLSDMKQKSFGNSTLYYDATVSESEAAMLFDYLKKNEFFVEGANNDVTVRKGDNDAAIFQFPVRRSFANEEGMQIIESFVTKMKTDLFSDVSLTFQVMDENYAVIKTYNL